MQTKARAQALREYTIDFRRELHAHPEASMEEHETSRRVKEELTAYGIEYREIGATGILASIHGKQPGRTILLRGDMDALSVQEELDLPYASKVKGMMHACGHDCHTAMLLTAGRMLAERREEFSGTVKLAFQPGEEVAKGAAEMIAAGALDGVDACYGSHVMAAVPYGKVGFCPGAAMAAAAVFHIHVQGKAGHGAMPHQTVDPIVAASAIVQNLQSIVSREIAPGNAVAVTVGEIHGGTRFNVVADCVEMHGTARAFDRETQRALPERLERIVTHSAAAMRAEATLHYEQITSVTENDPGMLELAKQATVRLFGEERVLMVPPSTGGEDFSLFSEQRPSAFVFLGSGSPDREVYDNHNGKFYVDERVLADGSALYVQVALDFLSRE